MEPLLDASRPPLFVCALMPDVSDGRCNWCANELPARRRRWCSDACAQKFQINHWWPSARRSVRRRDRYACRRCGRKRRDKIRLEVNHIEPALGRHSEVSCAHHLTNLETLCHECHRGVTSAQRAARAARPVNSVR